MPVFESKDKLHNCFGSLFESLIDRIIKENKLKEMEISVRFSLTDPDTSFSVIADKDVQKIVYDDDGKTDIEFLMTSDMAHQMLLGKFKLTNAIATGSIKAKGPFFKVLKILPYLKVSREIYPEHYQNFIHRN